MSTTGTARPAAVATATALGGLAALHVLWATGLTFPVHDADEFAETFLGVDGVGSRVRGARARVPSGLLVSSAGLRRTSERFWSLDLSVCSPLCLAFVGGLLT